MSSSLLRGLRALEMLAVEPLGVTELARRLDVDKAGVSRMLAALHAEGWVLRTGARYVLGERALGMLTTDPASVRRRARLLADRLSAATGLSASVVRLAGAVTQPLAVCSPDAVAWLDPPEPFEHLWATAAGIAVLAQLPDTDVDRLLSVSPWPAHAPGAPTGPAAVRALVSAVRAGSTAEERGWTIPGVGCIALPWPVPGAAGPHAALLLGPIDTLEQDADRLRGALREEIRRA